MLVAAVWLQVEATNELGDVYAQFGSWKEAVQAWNDALDCIIGPYQVCTARRFLKRGSLGVGSVTAHTHANLSHLSNDGCSVLLELCTLPPLQIYHTAATHG